MELSFQKLNGQWVAEFEATSDFNINLDRVGKGTLFIYLKGSKDGTYASQASYRNIKDSENVDADVTALVYPKYIKVVSQTEVVKGIVTMDGEGGSSASGGLRPATADDIEVSMEKEMEGSSIIEDWANELQIPSNATINIHSKKEAPMYINISALSGLNVSYLSLLNRISIYNGAAGPSNLTLDIYIKD